MHHRSRHDVSLSNVAAFDCPERAWRSVRAWRTAASVSTTGEGRELRNPSAPVAYVCFSFGFRFHHKHLVTAEDLTMNRFRLSTFAGASLGALALALGAPGSARRKAGDRAAAARTAPAAAARTGRCSATAPAAAARTGRCSQATAPAAAARTGRCSRPRLQRRRLARVAVRPRLQRRRLARLAVLGPRLQRRRLARLAVQPRLQRRRLARVAVLEPRLQRRRLARLAVQPRLQRRRLARLAVPGHGSSGGGSHGSMFSGHGSNGGSCGSDGGNYMSARTSA